MEMKQTVNRKERDVNLDLLKIIGMLFIIGQHYIGYLEVINRNNLYVLAQCLFVVAVNCYILVTGYYATKMKFKLRKIINLWAQVVFYSYLFLFLHYLLKISPIQKADIKTALFPVSMEQYWFITCYIALMLFVPALNVIIKKTNQKQLLYILILLTIVRCILPIIKASTNILGNALFDMCYLYLLRKFYRIVWKRKKRKQVELFCYLPSCMCLHGSTICSFHSIKFNKSCIFHDTCLS